MKLNRYILKIPRINGVILYNTVNDMIVECNIKDLFDKNTKKILKENGFFDSNKMLLFNYLNNLTSKRTQLDITISLTESCNLRCKYCSQSSVKSNSFITKNILDDIVKYVEICVKKYKYKTVTIHLFGGEPLLLEDKILYINEKLKKINVPINYYMDTNGVLLNNSFINAIDNLTFCVTLSEKNDHDILRVTHNNKGSYDLIINNLKKIQNCLNKKHKLMIRYNINDKNINNFEPFLKSIQDLNVSNVIIAYTDNYKNNEKTNKLSYKQYKKWNSTKALQILSKYNFPIDLPTSSFFCKGYERYSIKVFSNGMVGMCNSYDLNKAKVSIRELVNSYEKSNNLLEPFVRERNIDNFIDKKCKKCKFIYICNGKYFCKENPCEFLDYNIKKYIKTYSNLFQKNEK